MPESNKNNFIHCPNLMNVVDRIVELVQPDTVYLYNQRINARDVITAFKVCIVADVADKSAAERTIYLQIDCDIPFDILLYTPEEWQSLTQSATSFAYKIQQSGTVVYNGAA